MTDSSILTILYSDSSFNGWVQRWGWDDAGRALSVLRGSDRVRDLKETDAGRHDVYITKNIMKRAHVRGSSEVFAYNSIVIDLDMHGEYSQQQREAAADALRAVVLDGCVLPSLFVHTGRGVQLWYLIKPVPASLGWLYDIAQNKIYDSVADAVEREGLPFEVDPAVKDAGRVVRLPGSWNYHVQRFGSWEVLERERYALNDLIAELGGMQEKKEKKPEKKKRFFKAGNFAPLCWKQKATIERLCKERGNMQGLRNTALYLYGAAVFQLMDAESAADALRALNEYGSMGLKSREVESVIRYYQRHGVEKHCKIETFFKLLEMDAEEIAAYYSSSKREAERQAARDRKAERNANIVKYKKQGFNVSQIAEALAVSRPTVYAVLESFADVLEEAKAQGKNGLRLAVSFVRMILKAPEKYAEVLGRFPDFMRVYDAALCMSGAPPG